MESKFEHEPVAWTPYQIMLIIHYHVSPAPFYRSQAPIWRATVDDLVAQGILAMREELFCYQTTAKGDALVKSWQSLSLPVQPVAWIEERDLQYILRGKGLQAIVFTDEYEQRRPLYATPPAPPTKGPEDDLIAARESAAYRAETAKMPKLATDFRRGVLDETSAVQSALLALRSRPASALPVVGEAGKLAPGCCSAISPCSHQRQDPRSICDTCRSALISSVQP